MNLAADLARYGTAAEWRGVYYRGEKIGFTVSQMSPSGPGFELQEDARLKMALLGATTAASIRTTAQLDADFSLTAFDFSLDPGTGPVQVAGAVSGTHLSLRITTPSGTQTEERDLPGAPVLSLSLPRRLAAMGFEPGTDQHFLIFDPATLRNEPVTIHVGKREIVELQSTLPIAVRGRRVYRPVTTSIPAFRLEMTFAGLNTTSWVTDTGEVVREESPLGLLSVRESPADAQRLASRAAGIDGGLIESAAIVPRMTARARIGDPRDVRRMRIRAEGLDLANPDMTGAGQSVQGDVIETQDPRTLQPGPVADVQPYLAPEPLIESDDPAIISEARKAVGSETDPRARAERLVRYVNALLDKKPTVSLPSAREVLRTKVGDCNEHTALYVAMARSLGIPARIAVGLAYVRGAFYYHAWPEVYLSDGATRGLWLPVDPTFNQFPADATHVRLMRGGLDKQAAILPLIGHVSMNIVELDLAPNSTPILVGRGSVRRAADSGRIPLPHRSDLLGIAFAMIAIDSLVKRYGSFTAVDGVSLEVAPGQIHGFLGPNGAGKTTTIRMIAGLLKPTSGRIMVNGHDLARDPEQAKASLGFIPDRPFIYEKLTAGEFLRFHAGLYGLDDATVPARIREMLELFELGKWEHELVESFSHGMKQRLVMSAAFLHRPRAVLVDEPMVGLDPRGARLIKDVFRRMSGRGVAILMSTHTLEVAQEMCDRISIILKGRIIASGTVEELKALAGEPGEQLTEVFLKLTGGSGLQEIDDVL